MNNLPKQVLFSYCLEIRKDHWGSGRIITDKKYRKMTAECILEYEKLASKELNARVAITGYQYLD